MAKRVKKADQKRPYKHTDKRNRPLQKWDDSFYVQAYRIAKLGQSDRNIAKALGISEPTLVAWRKTKPALELAIQDGRAIEDSHDDWESYVWRRLPEHLQEYYADLQDWYDDPDGNLKVVHLNKKIGKRARQVLFIHALACTLWDVNKALRMCGLAHTTFRQWVEFDANFRELLDEMHQAKKNFFEQSLIKLVKEGDSRAITFVNKTINADRGYGEKLQVEHSGNVEHQHSHAILDLTALNLPPDILATVLEHAREHQPQAIETVAVRRDESEAE